MQSLLDVCYEYRTDNDILFNSIKSLCTVFKPKAYERFTPTVFIGDDALKFTREAKYLGFTFNNSKCDDSDMLRQMRLLYAKSNTLLHIIIVHRTLKLLCFKAVVRHCIVLCGTIRVAFNNAYRKIFGLSKLSRASAIYATHNICNFETMLRKNIMVLCKDWSIALTL